MLKRFLPRIKAHLRPARFRLARLAVTLHTTRQKIERVKKPTLRTLERLQPAAKPRLEHLKAFTRKQITHYKTSPYLTLAAHSTRQPSQAGQSWRRMEMPLATGAAQATSPDLRSELEAGLGLELGQGQVIAPFTPPETPARPISTEAQTPASRWKKPPPGTRLFSKTEEVIPKAQDKSEISQTVEKSSPSEIQPASRPPSVQRLVEKPSAPPPSPKRPSPEQTSPAKPPTRDIRPPHSLPISTSISEVEASTDRQISPPGESPSSRPTISQATEQTFPAAGQDEKPPVDQLFPKKPAAPAPTTDFLSPQVTQTGLPESPAPLPIEKTFAEQDLPSAKIEPTPDKTLPASQMSDTPAALRQPSLPPATPESPPARTLARLPFLPLIYRRAQSRQSQPPAGSPLDVASPTLSAPPVFPAPSLPTRILAAKPALRAPVSVVRRLTQKTLARLTPPGAQPSSQSPLLQTLALRPRQIAQSAPQHGILPINQPSQAPQPPALESSRPDSPQSPTLPASPRPQESAAPSDFSSETQPEKISPQPPQFTATPPIIPSDESQLEQISALSREEQTQPGAVPLASIRQRAETKELPAKSRVSTVSGNPSKPALRARRASLRASYRQSSEKHPVVRRIYQPPSTAAASLQPIRRGTQSPVFPSTSWQSPSSRLPQLTSILRRFASRVEPSPQADWLLQPSRAVQAEPMPVPTSPAARQPLPQTVVSRFRKPQSGATGEAPTGFQRPAGQRPASPPPGPPPRPSRPPKPDAHSPLEMPPVQRRPAAAEPALQSAALPSTPAGVVQRMLQDNSSGFSEETGLSDTTPGGRLSKVNVHALAKQVYPIIKRMLQLEKERTTGRTY